MANPNTALAAVMYYAQEGYYQHIQTEVLEMMKKNGSEPLLVYWKAYSLVMSGRLMEGMRELERIMDKQDVILCALMLLIYAHKKCETVDREAVQKLEAKVRSERTNCGEKSLYNAGMFLWLNGRHDKAREYVDRMLKITPSSDKGLALRGWIDLTSGREVLVKKSLKYFDDSMTGPLQPKLVEALFGKAKYYLLRYNFSHSLNMLNQAVASYDEFIPALIEKMKVQLALQDWEQASETAQRCLGLDVNCIEAVRMQTLSLLARDGNYSEASDKIGELIQLIDRFEPDNHALYHDMSLAFARMAEGKNLVLQQTMTLVNRALSLSPNNAVYINELAYQYYLSGQNKDALIYYKKALNTDETSVTALAGIIFFQIVDGHLSEAEQQLEFLEEVQSSIGKQATLIFLNALLAQKRKKPSSDVMSILNETVDVHFTIVKGTPLSIKYFQLLNPYFLLEVVKAIMVYAPTEPVTSQSLVDPVLKRAAAILDPLSKSMPGMVSSLYHLSRINFLIGEFESSQVLLQKAIEKDGNFMEAHLLMARLQLHLGNIKQCSASLEIALSSNFEVQNYPIYHLIKAKSERHVGDLKAALASLMTAMNFIVSKKSQVRPSSKLLPPLNLSEQATVYLELASIHNQLGNSHEATKTIQDAINEFTGTTEELRIAIANAEFALARGDTDEALLLLRNVSEENTYYIQAKEKMAEIYLNKKKDSKLYISCYEELAQKLPGPPTALLLGDAYMNVQEPEKALIVYEAALKRNSRDSTLARKIGQALIKTHNYSKAVLYYETALKSDMQQFLRGDLAELYFKLGQFDKAEKTLQVALEQREEGMDLSHMIESVKFMMTLSKIHRKAKRPEKCLEVLSNATDLQSKILTRVAIEQPDALQAQKTMSANICYNMADLSQEISDNKNAIRFYSDALTKKPDFTKARLALARLFLNLGEMEACDQECVTLIQMDQDNEEATLMRADLLLTRGSNKYKEAVQQLQDLLSRKPSHFKALYRLVELMRKLGELESAQKYLDRAEKVCSQSAYEPGLNFCKGLYKRYKLEMNTALQDFNQARRDSDWGEMALFNMIEICLNPDNDMIAGEALRPFIPDNAVSDDQMAIRTAEKLLLEIHPQTAAAEQRVRVLECYILLNTRQKSNIEKALETFMSMATTNRNDISLLLGIAMAYTMIKQVPRARNQLKIASKMQWAPEHAEEFEQTWLLLADVYIQSSKFDMALDLLKKCILYNKSCSKAWEYKGFIAEKEQAYKDASTCYEKAWRYSYHANPSIGFKLGFNYLKAKWFVEAIEVCHQILEKHPNYPKIKKDILDKARMSLRT